MLPSRELRDSWSGAAPVPFWLDHADRSALDASVSTDLVVVGGGFSGLWTDLLAKERDPGRQVVLIEASARPASPTATPTAGHASRRVRRLAPPPPRRPLPQPLPASRSTATAPPAHPPTPARPPRAGHRSARLPHQSGGRRPCENGPACTMIHGRPASDNHTDLPPRARLPCAGGRRRSRVAHSRDRHAALDPGIGRLVRGLSRRAAGLPGCGGWRPGHPGRDGVSGGARRGTRGGGRRGRCSPRPGTGR